ncbi:dienelactone hydrolase [Chania multitudinisentens RB-25]|uniref:Dienelactone hydrolase n=1 Tax=Chania multitudinisentens RB-25 TaxID=1441930 RepID=W0LA46_9GAMM|nr:dienelactone hydrolase [Chania multitudinisentens]AHG19147.1 dienelactone hydrolase [Chania multitudinisentens RB-25]
MKKLCILWLLFSSLATAAPWQVASRLQTFHHGDRQLVTRIYYPTHASGQPQSIEHSQIFNGINALPDAPPAIGHFPLVILSHGSGGNHGNQAWLAQALVRQGVIVAAANHPGSTTGNSVPAQSVLLWQQTQDISALLDAMLNDSTWQPRVNTQAIGVMGHSKGGYSAIATIGGQVVLQDFIAGCQRQPQSPNCQFYQEVKLTNVPAAAFNANYTDTRFQFAVALDPGMVPYLTPASLRQLNAPLLIVAAQHYMPGNADNGLGSSALAAYHGQHPITAVTLPGTNHFDFLPLCSSTALAILAQEDETVICASTATQRERAHQQTIKTILAFIQPWLSTQSGNQ